MILAGDIGGTKINLALFEFENGELELKTVSGYRVEDFDSFEEALGVFLKQKGVQPEKACIGAAGPVENGRCRLTNFPWDIETNSLKQRFGISEVLLVNDLAATAASVPILKKQDLQVIQAGEPVSGGRKAVMSSGTGLGQAFLIPDGTGGFEILDTEGGQCGLAPTCREEFEILSKLSEERSPLSIEDVLSGNGLVQLHRYYLGLDDVSGKWEALSPREIVENGMDETSGPCQQAVNRFISILGAVAGDMALQLLTRGGIYIGGGIPPRLSGKLQQGGFLNAFNGKEKFRDFMKSIPVFLIRNEQAPLWGAAGLLTGNRVRLATV